MLNIQFGVAKVNKYASRESGDTVEIIERPVGLGQGGFTAILADGQGSGKSAKNISNFVAIHCAELIKQGVRDSVVARAASDQLYNYKNGQVSATLNLLTADFATGSLVITRNNPQPVFLVATNAEGEPTLETLDAESAAIGLSMRSRPVIYEKPLQAGMLAVAFSDGIIGAGQRYNPTEKFEIGQWLLANSQLAPTALADTLLEVALEKDRRRPQDDMSVVVLGVSELKVDEGVAVPRRMTVEASFSGVTRSI